MKIVIVEAYYKAPRFPMQIGTKWRMGKLIDPNSMTGAEYWNLQIGNRARGVDEFGNEYAFTTFVSHDEHYVVSPFNDGITNIWCTVKRFNEGKIYEAIWVREEDNRSDEDGDIDLNKLRDKTKWLDHHL